MEEQLPKKRPVEMHGDFDDRVECQVFAAALELTKSYGSTTAAEIHRRLGPTPRGRWEFVRVAMALTAIASRRVDMSGIGSLQISEGTRNRQFSRYRGKMMPRRWVAMKS